MQVVVKRPNQTAEVKSVDASNILDAMQQLVSGYVQAVDIGPDITLLCDEDGLAKDLQDNCGFVGPIVFVQNVLCENPEEGYTWGSLSEENTRKALLWCDKHANEKHPDRQAPIQILTSKDEIELHRARLAMDAQSRYMEWENL
jgi:hypothetical protein